MVLALHVLRVARDSRWAKVLPRGAGCEWQHCEGSLAVARVLDDECRDHVVHGRVFVWNHVRLDPASFRRIFSGNDKARLLAQAERGQGTGSRAAKGEGTREGALVLFAPVLHLWQRANEPGLGAI